MHPRPRSMRAPLALVAAVVLVGAACGDRTEPGADPGGVEDPPPEGVSVVAEGLSGPTQITEGPDGLVVVAQLNGPESAGTGQVLALDSRTGQRRVLLDELDKPTGVLWLDGQLWVMQRRSLLRAEWSGQGLPKDPEVVLGDLPYNGRSEGTLTALDDSRFLYETSGAISSGEVVDGSGVLWAFDTGTGESTPLATGFKNAYAHVVRPDGSVLSTEVGDNVEDPPRDELHLLPADSIRGASDGAEPPDAGWPGCPPPGDCPGVEGAAATFERGATPTGVASVGDRAFIALFVPGSLVEVDLGGWVPGEPPRRATPVVEGLRGPHTLLARPDGTLWVSEHLAGRIVSVDPG
ncbi:MAG: hypothetical protein R2716_05090 [Microthrixaceae bacterium]